MFQLLKKICICVVLVLIYLLMYKESIIENWLSTTLNTPVTVGRVNIGPSGMKIRHLCIHNTTPSDKYPYALEAEYVEMRYSLISMLLSKTITISHLSVHGAIFSFFPQDLQASKTNWMALWNQYQPEDHIPQSFISTKLNEYPIFVRSCVFVHPRVYGVKMNHKDFGIQTIPSLEFRGQNIARPNLINTIRFLLYLSVEEGLFHAGLPADVVNSLSKDAHTCFSSSQINNHQTYLVDTSRPKEDIASLARELLFH